MSVWDVRISVLCSCRRQLGWGPCFILLIHLLTVARAVPVTMDQSSGYHHQGENHRVPSLRCGLRMLGCGRKILQFPEFPESALQQRQNQFNVEPYVRGSYFVYLKALLL